jgi:hypothetical protein
MLLTFFLQINYLLIPQDSPLIQLLAKGDFIVLVHARGTTFLGGITA